MKIAGPHWSRWFRALTAIASIDPCIEAIFVCVCVFSQNLFTMHAPWVPWTPVSHCPSSKNVQVLVCFVSCPLTRAVA